jgi:hypothetical protein
MNQVIYLDGGIKAVLTTESASSHYRIPVLRITYRDDTPSVDLGPCDYYKPGMHAAYLVCFQSWAMGPETLDAARAFCSQWPQGPQP